MSTGPMDHLTEEQLILHYYGEEGDALACERHLDECEACRGLYASLQRVLNVVDAMPVPECGPEFGERVWAQIAPRIPGRRRLALPVFAWRWAAAGAACAGLMVAAFLAGRLSQPRTAPVRMTAAADQQARERILLVAVGDYLERSQLVLVELANANPKRRLDISAEQERAGDLVSESRLYRQTALGTGNTAIAGVLDDLDRVLLDIAHSPSELSPGELEKLRHRLEAEGILFKIRVLGTNVRSQEEPPKLEGNPAS
jgi:hypothetical protein